MDTWRVGVETFKSVFKVSKQRINSNERGANQGNRFTCEWWYASKAILKLETNKNVIVSLSSTQTGYLKV